MKLKTIAAIMAAMAVLPASAQNNQNTSSDESKTDGWARRFAHNIADSFLGKDYYVETEDDDTPDIVISPNGRITFNNTEITFDSEEAGNLSKKQQKKYRHYGSGHTPSAYIGVNMLCTQSAPDLAEGIDQRVGKGFEFGIALGQWGYYFNDNICFNTASYLSRSRYWLGKSQWLGWQDDRLTVNSSDVLFEGTKKVSQGYLRYWSVRIPLCIEFSSSHKKGPFVAFGPELEWRFAEVSKVRLSNGDKRKVTKDLNLNPLAVNMTMRAGMGNVGLIARYSFTELFQQSSPVQAYPFTIAISTSF